MSSKPIQARALLAALLALSIAAPLTADAGQATPPQRTRPRPQQVAPGAETDPVQDPGTALETLLAAAESALKDDEVQIAESRYRDGLTQGWLLLGGLDAAEGRLAQARDALRRAAASSVDARIAQRSLAIVLLRTGDGDASEALGLLTQLASRSPTDATLRRLLAQALVANRQPEQAVQELEEAHGVMPDDLELAFALASGYLRLKKITPAEELLDGIARARPQAATYVLIGRTYRDFGEYGRARAMLHRALKMNPRVRRAHYYLGTIAIMEEGFAKLDEATREFQQELTLAPRDPVTNLRLGIVLEEAKRHAEALPALELAARDPAGGSEAFEYLGRCQLALGRTEAAAATLQRALDLSSGTSHEVSRIGRLHYQLATALRALGRDAEASTHFAQAERSSEARADTSRERLARYLADVPDPDAQGAATPPAMSTLAPVPFAGVSPTDRATIRKRVTDALARAYLNLGIVHTRANRFARAAAFFEGASAADPDFPQVQYSLGVAYFNAHQFEKATGPLERAMAAGDQTQADARRMLALSWLNLEAYDKAANLLKDDAQRANDPALQYTYALALVRSGHADEAQQIFSRLLTAHGDSPELNVLLGQAHAQQGNYPAAIEALRRALTLKSDVREANTALGFIYFKQGRFEEAAEALRAELRAYPDEVHAMQTLAAVRELQGDPNEAVGLLRSALKLRPQFADARYLLGKILLAQGSTAEAVDHLEAAARLAPEEANIHFQLAQAYQKSGRADLSEQQFELYRKLKVKKREGAR